jgi:hypothetical protein
MTPSHEPTPSPLPRGEPEPATRASNEAPLLGGAGGGFMAAMQVEENVEAFHEPNRSADSHVRANTLRRTRGLGGPRSIPWFMVARSNFEIVAAMNPR